MRAAAEEAGRDPDALAVCVAAPAYVGDDLAHARDQCRWFGGMVGNHVADLVRRYGEHGEIPEALTDYIRAREGYDYSHHGRVGNPDTEFVPDEIVDRFCVLGTADDHVAKLRELESLGVDPVQHLPHARRAGGDARRLRRPTSSPRCGPDPGYQAVRDEGGAESADGRAGLREVLTAPRRTWRRIPSSRPATAGQVKRSSAASSPARARAPARPGG